MKEFKIIFNPEYTSTTKLGIKIIPDNSILRSFLASIDTQMLPKLVAALSKSKRFGVENARILFFDEMDWEDKEGININSKQLSIFVYDRNPNETVIDESIFDKIIFDFCTSALEVYMHDKSLPKAWMEDLKIELLNLKKKN